MLPSPKKLNSSKCLDIREKIPSETILIEINVMQKIKRAVLLLIIFNVSIIFPVKAVSAAGKSSMSPNVVLLIIDTLRADKLGCYGFDENTSPELDKLAEKGVQFNWTLAQSNWTLPSHGSFLTALYPRTLGLYEMPYILGDKFTTLPELLRKAGYTTLGITANPQINTAFNFDQGFDKYIDSVVLSTPMAEKYKMKGEKVWSKKVPFSLAEDILPEAMGLANSVKRFPVYLQINVMDVHESGKRVVIKKLKPGFRKLFNDSGYSRLQSRYYKVIRNVSYHIGKFIDQLTAVPGWENTLFIIISDHGQGLGDHAGVRGEYGHGTLLYSTNLWVPFIMYHHGGSLKPKKINRHVRLMDMMPTVLDYLGLPIPDNLDGVSLLKMINGNESDVDLPEYFVVETELNGNKIAVYSKDWKYIENRDDARKRKNRKKRKITAVNKFELHPVGIKEKGVLTDIAEKKPGIVKEMKRFLNWWEKRYPKEKRTALENAPFSKEIEQLKMLGYPGEDTE